MVKVTIGPLFSQTEGNLQDEVALAIGRTTTADNDFLHNHLASSELKRAAGNALDTVRTRLLDPAVVEAAAKAHCDVFGGDGWWENPNSRHLHKEMIVAMKSTIEAVLFAAISGGV